MQGDITLYVLGIAIIASLVIFELPWTRDQKLSAVASIVLILFTLNSLWRSHHSDNYERNARQLNTASLIGGAHRGAAIALAIKNQLDAGIENPAWIHLMKPWVESEGFINYWQRYHTLFSPSVQQAVAQIQQFNKN